MAKERLKPISLHQEMQRSYLEYAMSVIVGRALPDARDGLKPVQRRILFAMHELGLTPDRPYRKCARVVGDVLGKYHPHGDQAVYDALVRLVQDFASRYPVLDGHGNFGSVDDDPPAAMRYTETRLAPIAHEALLDEIGENTVDFNPNFDGSQQEPSVLPAQLPFLLLNGCSGIAVGMATSIPPHNLNELVNGLIALIQKPELSDEKLAEIIPGPDFPTGGEVLKGSGLRETYLRGKGSIPMRGLAHIEEVQPGKGRHKRRAVVVTELPYQLSKAGWIEKLADQVNEGKIGGIADIRDESDRDGMRILVELRRDVDADKVLKDLHRKTSLQSNFGAIMLALVNGQPKQLSLKLLLQTFVEYRELTVVRRIQFSLTKTEERLKVVNGLIKALNNLKEVINLIQDAPEVGAARAKLIVHLEITEKQADAILAMPLRRLTGLEQKTLREESKNLDLKRKELKSLLDNRDQLLKKIIEELKALKKKFGNPRKTRLIEGGDELLAEKTASQRPNTELQRQQAFEALNKDGKIIIQADRQVKIVSPQTLGRLHLDQESSLNNEISPAEIILSIESKPRLLAVTENGRVALIRWEFAGQQPGTIDKFLPGGLEGEKIVKILSLPLDQKLTLGLLSSDGRFKRLPLDEILEMSGRASTVLKLKKGILLKSAIICYPKSEIIIVSDIGRMLKLSVNDKNLPIMGKLAQGPTTMRLLPNENIAGAVAYQNQEHKTLFIASENGLLAKLDISHIRSTTRGSLGDIGIEIKEKTSQFDKIIDVADGETLISLTTSAGRNTRVNAKNIILDTSQKLNISNLELRDQEVIEKIYTLIN
ncbi:DNA topoisomerase (ATP-hydrolyzing) [Prochlorococcus sp. MIT 1300]|uniref:DNA gyrase/topoisomerase IV subunit A n=1 Tax=Prochlorococcus sp. MIT 1300 TaxID=3096218 RepID=UPI002A758A82|nr:DNA topoisomerase (ATP-hydrolyzing) [Prochlorococcus sp. MIT 1300]